MSCALEDPVEEQRPRAMEHRFCAAQSTEQNHSPAALLVTFQAPLAVLLRPPDTQAGGNKQEIEG